MIARTFMLVAMLAASPALAQTESIITGGGQYIGDDQSGKKDKFFDGRRGPRGQAENEKAIRDNFFYGGNGEPVGQVFTDQNDKD
ncbi:MAG: hypothetical protein ACR652_09190 [Methylocystis sp.]|uniref:hypothetical protein n=1 Tax=Methylocystis sp. TaxID=1911079 RepID=UPI003DA22CB7